MKADIGIFEVGPRDGLQNEKTLIPTAAKIQLVDMLSACGLGKIEVTSFVHPDWVPQLADAGDVMVGIHRADGVSYTVLVPNLKGFERSLSARPDEIAIFASASEGFSQKNINCTIAESLERFQPVLVRAKEQAIPVRGYISCVTDCPYDGPTPPENVANVAAKLIELGCYEVSLGDTIGHGTPATVQQMLERVLTVAAPTQLAGHFHDTQGRALENIQVCLDHGLRVFDGAVGGLGGCPYAPGAKGNVATEDVVRLMESKGFSTGIDLAQLRKAGEFAKSLRTAP